jgi:phosphohistidine phosphatase
VRVLLIRHADAVPEGASLTDEHRHLTREGRDAARELGRMLATAELAPGAVFSSPLVRALQTAELVAASLGWTGLVETAPRMAPISATRTSADWLRRQAGALAPGLVLVAVGHEPSISALTQVLTGVEQIASFRKAEARFIEDGELRWQMQPGA